MRPTTTQPRAIDISAPRSATLHVLRTGRQGRRDALSAAEFAQARRLRELERENDALTRIVARTRAEIETLRRLLRN